MALIQLGPLISGIKGSIGGTTFSAIRAGIIAKPRLVGKRDISQKQRITLNESIAVTNQWNNLSASNKVLWNDYAVLNDFTDRYGVVKTLTGYNFFKLINTASFFVNGSYLSVPPAHAIPTALSSFTVATTSTDIIITPSLSIDPVTTGLEVFTTAPIKNTSVFKRGSYRLTPIGTIDYSVPFSIKTPWENTHNLDYISAYNGAEFNINVMLVPIDKSSFVTGAAQSAIGTVDQGGIGFWEIPTSFEIQ